MQCGGPLRRGGIAGQGGEKDGPQCAPCAGGRPAGWTTASERRRGGGAGWGGAAFRRVAVHGLCKIQANRLCSDYRT